MKNTKVKIFHGQGSNEIQNLEKKINDWLTLNPKISVLRSEISSSSIGKFQNQLLSYFIVLVWYDEHTGDDSHIAA